MNKNSKDNNKVSLNNKTIINPGEQEERGYLAGIKKKLHDTITRIDRQISRHAREVKEFKEYLWENKAGMDHAEKVSVRQSVEQGALTGEAALAKKKRLHKLIRSPYFGRIDFSEHGRDDRLPIYIGIHSYFDEEDNLNLIHDWRAPVSGMFYDFETGEAFYRSPDGEINGDILLKRQYRIREGEMEFMLESDLNIHDELLQEELSKASDDKMKNIVATIQRDQNAIIRNEISGTLIIQGVAGSGKTSVALHRIAFLLYRYKDTITSRDILILSPNKVFADYIANVLPELGEDKIPEKGMEELAAELLDHKFRFQNFFQQVGQLLEKDDESFIGRIRFKATFEFLNKLNQYLLHIENNYFQAEDMIVKRYPVPGWFIEERLRALHRVPLFRRFERVARDVEENIRIYYQYEITGAERNSIRSGVRKMFRITAIRNLYKDLFEWLGKPEMFKTAKGSILEYSDVFPLIYLKIRLEGISALDRVKHLLVDEMQDYTPVQYAVLGLLFPCRKTILGDAGQSVNPYSSSNSSEIQKALPGADCVELTKSYRSTCEIISFARRISGAASMEVIERHGDNPEVKELRNKDDEIREIKDIVGRFMKTGQNSLGIICKTQKQADRLHSRLKEDYRDIYLLNSGSTSFSNGVIITSVHLAKGLEFDQVIVPFATAVNYTTEVDRGLLYIACTRAMHKLTLTYTKECTGFIVRD